MSISEPNLPEFNIEQALKGHLVQLRNGKVAIVVYNAHRHNIINPENPERREPLVGFLFNPDTDTINFDYTYFWALDGAFNECSGDEDIVGMYNRTQSEILEYAFKNNKCLKAHHEKFGYASVKPIGKTRDGEYMFIEEDAKADTFTLLKDYTFELV